MLLLFWVQLLLLLLPLPPSLLLRLLWLLRSLHCLLPRLSGLIPFTIFSIFIIWQRVAKVQVKLPPPLQHPPPQLRAERAVGVLLEAAERQAGAVALHRGLHAGKVSQGEGGVDAAQRAQRVAVQLSKRHLHQPACMSQPGEGGE